MNKRSTFSGSCFACIGLEKHMTTFLGENQPDLERENISDAHYDTKIPDMPGKIVTKENLIKILLCCLPL